MKRIVFRVSLLVLILFESCTKPIDPEPNNLFEVYPNPARDVAFFRFRKVDEPGRLQVIDAAGKIIFDATIETVSVADPIDLKDSPDGKCHAFFRTPSATTEYTFIKLSR
jgi:hypothetical protein